MYINVAYDHIDHSGGGHLKHHSGCCHMARQIGVSNSSGNFLKYKIGI